MPLLKAAAGLWLSPGYFVAFRVLRGVSRSFGPRPIIFEAMRAIASAGGRRMSPSFIQTPRRHRFALWERNFVDHSAAPGILCRRQE